MNLTREQMEEIEARIEAVIPPGVVCAIFSDAGQATLLNTVEPRELGYDMTRALLDEAESGQGQPF